MCSRGPNKAPAKALRQSWNHPSSPEKNTRQMRETDPSRSPPNPGSSTRRNTPKKIRPNGTPDKPRRQSPPAPHRSDPREHRATPRNPKSAKPDSDPLNITQRPMTATQIRACTGESSPSLTAASTTTRSKQTPGPGAGRRQPRNLRGHGCCEHRHRNVRQPTIGQHPRQTHPSPQNTATTASIQTQAGHWTRTKQ